MLESSENTNHLRNTNSSIVGAKLQGEEIFANFLQACSDGAPPHWSTIVHDFLNRELPHRWIGRTGLDDVPLLPWPPDLTPCDFFLWSYVKDKVYVIPMPTTLKALQERITAGVTDIDENMLLNVWTELYYRWDVCQVTKGAHIEHL
ncbi:hypothetical protein AVEN_194499-1 [Araneus ventricosus]|uniref:Uncharacterized protein n=1 Tax=Araneus ventricosus TaxID=182803 RepID=A0A4Y2A8M6_ARAVE|nr:hypothetical protein AVEN_194499-1 [Araneus ventricosus]